MRNHRLWFILLLCTLSLAFLLALPQNAPATAAPAAQEPTWVFSGRVTTPDQIGIPGVEVRLLARQTLPNAVFSLVANTTTNADGFFILRHTSIRHDYRVQEVNLPGYGSVSASAPAPAVVLNADLIEYLYPNGLLLNNDNILFIDRFTGPTNTPTITPTPSRTPTRTSTPTRTPTPVDLTVTNLEITQSIQNLADSVPLVAHKRTYVRAHVRSLLGGNIPGVLGQFQFVGAGLVTPWYTAHNPGGRITVKTSPNRGIRDDSFFIEIPPQLLGAGPITCRFRMNEDHAIVETNFANNGIVQVVLLQTSPPLRVKIFNVTYFKGGVWHSANNTHIFGLINWLSRAYPVPFVSAQIGTMVWPYATAPGDIPSDGGCGLVNSLLAIRRWLDGSPARRYYGMVMDTGGFMRGCSGIPSWTASGPTGTADWGWDFDGTYGDWYGGHELGHSLGRKHVACSGGEAGPDPAYPFPSGRIGAIGDSTTFYGWDTSLRRVYTPDWRDMMSYCDNQWISHYTYMGIRTWLILFNEPKLLALNAQDEVLLVVGQVNITKGAAELETLYRMSNIGPVEAPTPSEDWALALYDAGGAVLARYPFTPQVDPDNEGGDQLGGIQEAIPWAAGTARVAVEYRGTVVAQRVVSASSPVVQLLSPNGGETLDGAQVMVRWQANDPDGGLVWATLQYSADGGQSWVTLATDLLGNEFAVPLSELPGSSSALFRVIVSDGVNTGQDQSDGTFTVPGKPPMVMIEDPAPLSAYVSGQPIILAGISYDVEDGLLGDAALSWRSDLQGELGTGAQLGVDSLQAGRHLITLTAMDNDGMSASASVIIYVDVQPPTLYLPLILRNSPTG